MHDSGWRTDDGNRTRSVDFSLIWCLFRLVKCKFTEPLYKSACYTLLSLLIFSKHARCVKRDGHNLKKKKTRKYHGCCGCCIPLRLCKSIAQYCDCGYRESPTDMQKSACQWKKNWYCEELYDSFCIITAYILTTMTQWVFDHVSTTKNVWMPLF